MATAPNLYDFNTLSGNDADEAPFDFFNRRFLNWMSFIDGGTQLCDLTLPGTHESATYSMRQWITDIGPDAIPEEDAQCQSFNLLGQLLSGVRYLDLRVELNGDTLIFHHGSGKTEDITGRTVANLFETQIAPFLSRFDSEFVILDFQEICDNVGDQTTGTQDLINLIEEYLNPSGRALPTSKFSPQLTLGEIRQGGWNYMVCFETAAIATLGNNIPSWVMNRTGGTTPPKIDKDKDASVNPAMWSPWDGSDWNDGGTTVTNLITTLMNDWVTNGKEYLFVAQDIETPTDADEIIGNGPLWHEANGYVSDYNNWISDQVNHNPVSQANIIIRDALDWFPEAIANIIALNYDKGNLVDNGPAQAQFGFMLDAAKGARFYPALTGTQTAVAFQAMESNGNPEFPFFQKTQDNSELENQNWTLEIGTPDLPGSQTILSDDFHPDSTFLEYQSRNWGVQATINGQQGVISYVNLTSNWQDGTNGTFEIKSGWVLQETIDLFVSSYVDRGCHWSIEIQAIPMPDPSDFFYDYD